MRSMTSEDGDASSTIQGKELYELEVRLRETLTVSTSEKRVKFKHSETLKN